MLDFFICASANLFRKLVSGDINFEIRHHLDEVSMDEFIPEAMRSGICIENNQRIIDYLNTLRIILKNEVFICYQFFKEQRRLQIYHVYQDGK